MKRVNLNRFWLAFGALAIATTVSAAGKPNIVVVMADDMGWRDTGYHGNKVVKTPHLDDMASKGIQFDFFYPGQQMCSPGRFALMCGRNPCRTGLHHLGAMRPQEITMAKALKTAGYKTGQFGKWHLGGTNTSPAKMGFDRAIWAINYFDLGAKLQVGDTKEMVALEGDTSVATMNLALDFIRENSKGTEPFFAYVCFGSPHAPHRAAEEFKALYKDLDAKKQDYWGEVSGVDAAVGNLRAELKKLGIADNTIVWFTSDNGGITPESQDPSGKGKMTIGCRTQGLFEWPARVTKPFKTDVVVGHVDMYPTLLEIAGVSMPGQPVLDGVSLTALIDGKMEARPRPIGFILWNQGKGNKKGFDGADFVADTQGVWIDGKYKLIIEPDGKNVRLYDIYADQENKIDLAEKMPEMVAKMTKGLNDWRTAVRAGYDGKDYPTK
jgi:arylsulfatase A-like enzyme